MTEREREKKKVMNILQAGECRAAPQVTPRSLSESHRAGLRPWHGSDCLSAACRRLPALPAPGPSLDHYAGKPTV